MFGSRYHLPKCETSSINICGDIVVKSSKNKLLVYGWMQICHSSLK